MKITHDTVHTVSAGGKTYSSSGKDNVFDVPEEHARVLVESHGFRSLPESEAPPDKKGSKKAD